MTDGSSTGLALARAYFDEVVEPLLASRLPDLRYAAGRFGTGSDVLGLDDATSRDHDWGLRLDLVVPAAAAEEVDRALDSLLPSSFKGLPTRFAFSGEAEARHRVEVTSVAALVRRLGFDPRSGVAVGDWLSLTGQAVLEVSAGPVFVDHDGDLRLIRQALEWYPDDLWRYALLCDWARIAQELPLMGRAADVGDRTGSRIIAARLAQTTMHLAYLLERRWPPYAKWFGSLFRTLRCAADVGPHVADLVDATDPRRGQRSIAAALDHLLSVQNALGLTDVARATVPFWDRPHLHPDPAIVAQLSAGITDTAVRALPIGRGTIEQRTDNVDVLVDPSARRLATRL